MEAYTGVDSMELFLSGGASNRSPADSLGGEISSHRVRGMVPFFTQPVQGIVIEDATPENGEGQASIAVSGDQATYTPPDGSPGSAVTITAGQRKLLTGADEDKAVRILRVSGKTFNGTARFNLVDVMNGVFAMNNVSHADRQSGITTYRAVFLKALQDVEDVICWITTDGQSTYSMSSEGADSNNEIQTISNEEVAPAGLGWSAADSESTPLSLGNWSTDDLIGIWIKRVFPAAGTASPAELVNFHLQFVAG